MALPPTVYSVLDVCVGDVASVRRECPDDEHRDSDVQNRPHRSRDSYAVRVSGVVPCPATISATHRVALIHPVSCRLADQKRAKSGR
jgi:hypothetical protein